MGVTVVVGGQFGSEGKGKVSEWVARTKAARYVVRVGGPNSGHTVVDGAGTTWVFRHLPTAAVLPSVICLIGAGSLLDLDVLKGEIHSTGIDHDRLVIHPRAVMIENEDKLFEKSDLTSRIGSTGSGTGSALRRRMERKGVRFAADVPFLKPFVRDISQSLAKVARNETIVVEGTQGFGLSLLYGLEYPFVTSRDTTAAAFLSEAGLSPMDVEDVVMVLRCHPIRVAGNSGPLKNEFDWKTLSSEAQLQTLVEERTTVTRRIRRVAHFDADVVRNAIAHNSPSTIILNHLDYVAPSDRNCFLEDVEVKIDRKIDFVGFGPALLESRLEARTAI